MDLYGPRRAGLGQPPVQPTTVSELFLGRREAAAADSTHDAIDPADTISPYHQALNGVNQDMNMVFKNALWWMLGVGCLVVLAIRVYDIALANVRQVATLGRAGDNQTFWRFAQWSWMPSLKRHLMYAPLGSKRHNRELKLSSAMNMGTVPSRLHTLLLVAYVLANFVYMIVLNWSIENKYAFCAELRGRSGTLCLVNMVPLVILAGRNNPLIGLLKISFDTYNLLHRWLGRLVVVEAIIHTVAWMVVQHADGGWDAVWEKVGTHAFHGSGMVAAVSMVVLFCLALSPVRHAFYETFLTTHMILALVIFVCTYIHCVSAEIPGGLPQTNWMIAIFCLWLADRLARAYRLAYINWSKRGFAEATIEAMPAECTRVTFHLPRYLDVRPGTHCYIRFWGISAWENHPFSVAWVEHINEKDRLPVTERNPFGLVVDRKNTTTEVSFVIGAQTGFTRKLYNKALEGAEKPVRLRAAIEGPYAGHHCLDSYGHVVLFAGATGITHQISYVRHLVNGYVNGLIATRRVTLVWIIRDYESLEWIRPWMDEILRMPRRKEILRIQLYITRPKNPAQIQSASDTVQMMPGRPNTSLLLRKEVSEQIGAMAVSVCGPGALADDVREAVRQCQDASTYCDALLAKKVEGLRTGGGSSADSIASSTPTLGGSDDADANSLRKENVAPTPELYSGPGNITFIEESFTW